MTTASEVDEVALLLVPVLQQMPVSQALPELSSVRLRHAQNFRGENARQNDNEVWPTHYLRIIACDKAIHGPNSRVVPYQLLVFVPLAPRHRQRRCAFTK